MSYSSRCCRSFALFHSLTWMLCHTVGAIVKPSVWEIIVTHWKREREKKATKQKGLANWNVIWNLYFYQNTPNDFIYAFRRAFFSPISVLLPALFVFAFLFHSARFRWSFHFSSMRLELVLFAMPQASRIHFPFIQTNEWRGNILLCFFSVCEHFTTSHSLINCDCNLVFIWIFSSSSLVFCMCDGLIQKLRRPVSFHVCEPNNKRVDDKMWVKISRLTTKFQRANDACTGWMSKESICIQA